MPKRSFISVEVPVNQLENKTIIAVSDVHLGQRDKKEQADEQSNKSVFIQFLEEIKNDNLKCDYLIICGDFLDMWRRDLVGVVLENADIFHQLKAIKDTGTEVKFVVGNHDYYLRHIIENQFGYEFSFHKGISLVDGNAEYIFVHGDEFDQIQNEIFYDILCFSNDEAGQQMDSIWNFLQVNRNWLKRIWDRLKKGRILEGINLLLESAEKRFKDDRMVIYDNSFRLPEILPNLEQEALDLVKSNGQLLVFGHTHQPFVHKDVVSKKVIANTGTWVKQHKIHSTFIKINEKKIELYKYGEEQSLDSSSFH
ncbi:MAG: UDP-2,3-diacylglucosamine diphosphatase [Candidatus Hodarchaeales archaeon]|jgi:UDP-2,3-diacylglucosamine pyrophosphatase LpxH